jgi:hypothetical protein
VARQGEIKMVEKAANEKEAFRQIARNKHTLKDKHQSVEHCSRIVALILSVFPRLNF